MSGMNMTVLSWRTWRHSLTLCLLVLWAAAPPAWGAVVEVRPVILESQSPADTAAALPTTQSYVNEGQPFYCEVWAQTSHASGLSSVSFDLSFDPGIVMATGLTHSVLFSGLTNGAIDNGNGVVQDVSGSHVGPCTDAIGVAPNWARVAIIELNSVGYMATSLQTGPTGMPAFGSAICGVGDIDPAQIQYGGVAVEFGDAEIPTVSEWGLAVLALGVLIAATVILRGSPT
jgi:hypothetical protein